MEKVQAQSIGFHIGALALLALGIICAAVLVSHSHEPDFIMMKVDGHMVPSHVVARGDACSTSSADELTQSFMDDPLPVRGYLAK